MGMHTLNLGITGPFVVPEWKHRNAIVFDGASPSMSELLGRVKSEGMTWLSAGKFKGNVDDFFRGLFRWASSEE